MPLSLLLLGAPPLLSSPSPSPSPSSSKQLSSSLPPAPAPLHVKTLRFWGPVLDNRIALRNGPVVLPIRASSSENPTAGAGGEDGAGEGDAGESKLPPLQSKLEERMEQRLKMKMARKIRLRRKRLVRKRRLRKKGRWPPSKMKKLKNV